MVGYGFVQPLNGISIWESVKAIRKQYLSFKRHGFSVVSNYNSAVYIGIQHDRETMISSYLRMYIFFTIGNACPRTNSKANTLCIDECQPSFGCSDFNKDCLCDGNCGYSCVKKSTGFFIWFHFIGTWVHSFNIVARSRIRSRFKKNAISQVVLEAKVNQSELHVSVITTI